MADDKGKAKTNFFGNMMQAVGNVVHRKKKGEGNERDKDKKRDKAGGASGGGSPSVRRHKDTERDKDTESVSTDKDSNSSHSPTKDHAMQERDTKQEALEKRHSGKENNNGETKDMDPTRPEDNTTHPQPSPPSTTTTITTTTQARDNSPPSSTHTAHTPTNDNTNTTTATTTTNTTTTANNNNNHNNNNHNNNTPSPEGDNDNNHPNTTTTTNAIPSIIVNKSPLSDNQDHTSPQKKEIENSGEMSKEKKKRSGKFVPLPFRDSTPRHVDVSPSLAKNQRAGPPEILPEEIVYDEKADFIGSGSFGSVYKGMCRGQEVAVKVPKKQKLTAAELTSFRHEVKIMSKIFHPNVVLFLGACTQIGKMQIVTERCITDLEKLLAQDKKKKEFSLARRMQMAKDAALGVNWLHGINNTVHNDLKSANLLVDQNMRVKVTDFGFSQIKEGDQFTDKSKKGTPLWMAPEVMMGQPYNEKADVYSFGIILWELLTREVPYAHHSDYPVFFRAVCIDGERPVLPEDTLGSLRHLITSCWDHDPNNRPPFSEIVFRLNEVLVDCTVDHEEGRDLWKQHFLLPKQELVDQVPWREFEAIIKQHLQRHDLSLEDMRPLLVTANRDSMAKDKEVVTMERFDKVMKWFGSFFSPESGPAIIEEVSVLTTKEWFHGDITREEAMARLAKQEEGTFLIRLSSTDPKVSPFTLTMPGNQHRRIKRLDEEEDHAVGYRIQGKNIVYPSLIDLAEKCLDYNLQRPCPKKGFDGYSLCYGNFTA